MRKFTFLRSLFLLMVYCLIGTGASWAAEKTVTFKIASYNVPQGTELADHPLTEDEVTLADKAGKGSPKIRFWGSSGSGDLRVYQSNVLNVSVPEGFEITSIDFGKTLSNITASTGSISGSKWTGSAQEINFTKSSGSALELDEITVTYTLPEGYVSAPGFSVGGGTFKTGTILSLELMAAEDNTIYYALNNEAGDYQPYTGAISISENTTVYAYAQDQEGTKSETVSETYTFADLNIYTAVTSVEDLEEGATYLLVCENASQALSSQNGKYRNGVPVTVENGQVKLVSVNVSGQPYELILGKNSNGNYTFYVVADENYLSLTSNANNLNTSLNASATNAQWKITFSGSNMTITNASYSRSIKFNTSDPRFACYSSGQTAVRLYKKVEAEPTEGTFTIGEAGYATLFTDKTFVMPEGVEGAIVDGVTGDQLSLNYLYKAGNVVPANTGLLLKGEANEYTYEISTETPAAPEVNYLKGSVEEATTTGDGLYYMLSYDQNGENLGFYWGAEGGAAFTNGAGKAYLVLPSNVAQNVRGFALDGSTTGIDSVTTDTTSAPAAIYTLAGVRVNSTADRLPKGIYIVNGKKVIVK